MDDTISILPASRSGMKCITASRSPTTRSSAAAVLSHRYIGDRFLPDKAIDLVDEAASRLRMEIDSMPARIERSTPPNAAPDREHRVEQGRG